MTKRWRCVCAYDGTDFAGWQKQPAGDAVQDKIEQALGEIFQCPTRTIGAGRTDAGVHAKAQVFHFDAKWRHDAEDMLKAMRAHFPIGISPRSVDPAGARFHALLSAKGKRYRYRAVEGWAMPEEDRFVLSLKKRKPDLERMQEAAAHLVGTHDFSSFSASRGMEEDESQVRKVWRIKVSRKGALLEIEALGKGFLYKMVRSIAGALLDVGCGKIEPVQLKEILKRKKRTEEIVSAPAKGLCLEKVYYRRPSTK